MKLTPEQFRAQFPNQIVMTDELFYLMRNESIVCGYPIYRALDRLILGDFDGKFYIS